MRSLSLSVLGFCASGFSRSWLKFTLGYGFRFSIYGPASRGLKASGLGSLFEVGVSGFAVRRVGGPSV